MASVKCSKCGLVNWADSEKCRRCEAILAAESDPTVTPVVRAPEGGHADPRFVEYEDEYVIFNEAIKSNAGSDVALVTLNRIYGQLVLTNRRIIFLSSGSYDGTGLVLQMFGAAGSLINAVTAPGRIDGLSRNLDMSALGRPTSWALGLVSIINCRVGDTWYNGPFLYVQGKAQRQIRSYVLYGPDHTREDLVDRQIRVEEAIKDTKYVNESEQSDIVL